MAFGKAFKGFATQVAQKMQDKPAESAPAKGGMGRIAEKVGSAISGAKSEQPTAPAPAKGIMGRMASRIAEQVKNQPAPAQASEPAPIKRGLSSIRKRLSGMKFQEGGKVNEMKMMKKEGRGMAKADMQKKAYGGMMKGYAAGGMPMVEKDGKKVPAFAADGKGKMKSGGIASSLKAHASAPASKAHGKKKMMGGGMAKYAKGGMIDGCARKGKTKGKMV
jgi:hypothetical protein